jgi:preprotein translocase subunit Sec61beta
MAKEKKSQGFQSAAGLIRYFDAEDSNAIQISRGGVMLACLLAIIVVEISEALGRGIGAYVLLAGVVILILNEIRNRRSGSV